MKNVITETADCLGNPLVVGQEVVFSRNLWRGKDVMCKGIITRIAAQTVHIQVTSPEPSSIKDISLYEGWNIEKRAKTSKVFGL
jgi:hypothetical protein